MQGYFSLESENRQRLLLLLAKEYDLNRTQVRELLKQYLGLEMPSGESCVYASIFVVNAWGELSWSLTFKFQARMLSRVD